MTKTNFQIEKRAQNSVDILIGLSIAYLAIPNIIFVLFWFNWWIVCTILLLLCTVAYKRKENLKASISLKNWAEFLKDRRNASLLIIAIVVCFISGVGIFLPHGDVPKHHAILKILVEEAWPVEIYDKGEKLYLVYYTAWYLPAALISKLAGYQVGMAFLFIESVLGLFLVLCWLIRLSNSKKNSLVALGIFFLLDGQDAVFILLKHVSYYLLDIGGSPDLIKEITWQMSYFDYILRKFSAAYDLTFVPQQTLGAWLATLLLMHGNSRKNLSLSILIMSFSALWSILCTIGLLPIFFYSILKNKTKGLYSFENILLGIPFGLLLFFYFQSHLSIYDQGWIWDNQTTEHWFLRWVGFVLFEFGIYGLIMFKVLRRDSIFQLWALCNICLIIMSLYVFGLYNDLLMRASIPLHVVFVLATIRFYYLLKIHYKKQLLVVFIATCSLSFFLMIASLHYLKWQVGLPSIRANDTFSNMEKDDWFQRQYLGDGDSFYGNYLSR